MSVIAKKSAMRFKATLKVLRNCVFVFFVCIFAFVVSFGGAAFTLKNFTAGGEEQPVSRAPSRGLLVSSAFAEQVEIIGSESGEGDPSPNKEEYEVQAVLSPKKQTVVASGIDAKILRLKLDSGDKFKKGSVLVEYDCSIDKGRLKEAQSRQRVTQKQLEAYEKLISLESVSEIELLVARENNEQNKALVEQIEGRLKACVIHAPFDGRVTRRMASQHEFSQTGRVIMDVSSLDPLRAEFLVPSKWLRWLNIDTPLEIYIGETDRTYEAKIAAVHGEVDPVSQSIQIVADMQSYHEELLPGMSGRAIFSSQIVRENIKQGFLGLMLKPGEIKNSDTEAR